MGILWLILKIILFVLLALLGVLCLGILMILFSPIHYEAYLEKYDELAYDCKFTYLHWIKGRFCLEKGIKNHEIKAFGKILYEDRAREKPKETKERENDEKTTTEHVVTNIKSTAKNIKSDKKIKELNTTKTQSKKIDTPVMEEAQDVVEKTTDKVQEETKDFTQNLNLHQIKNLIFSKDFYGLLKEIYDLVKSILKYILPRKWSYEIVIGREDPADTGEMLAKLTMLYPLYYRHGIIRGDFEKAGIWGGFLAQGKFSLFGILRRIVIFLCRPIVRGYIKLILKIRKEEKDGE